MGEKYFQEFGPKVLTCLQLVGTWMKNIFRNFGPKFMTCPQLVGTWVKNIFRNLVLILVPKNIISWVHQIVFTGGLPPPRPPAVPGGLPAPQTPWRGACSPPCPPAQFLRGSASQALRFFWYQSFNAQVRQVRRFEPEPPNLLFFTTGSNLWTAMLLCNW